MNPLKMHKSKIGHTVIKKNYNKIALAEMMRSVKLENATESVSIAAARFSTDKTIRSVAKIIRGL